MREQFFMGGVTPEGFSTELKALVNSSEYFTYILKGGPGTGKSALMKKIADRFGDVEDVTLYYCSADPGSLDAVELHSSKTLIVDGTPPHVFEAMFPGVSQKVINLGAHWDENSLREHGDEIISVTRLNKSLLSGAAYYHNALGIICNSTYEFANRILNRQMIEDEAEDLCEKLFAHRGKSRGKQDVRQLSVMTMNGYMTLTDTLGNYSDIFVLNDSLFAASDVFIDIVAKKALEHGCSIKISPGLLFGKFVREHLLIDDISTVLVTVDPLTQLKIHRGTVMELSAFYDKEQIRLYDSIFKSNESLMKKTVDTSREMLAEAKRVHDEMEKYYIDAMDHEALDHVFNGICEEISLRNSGMS